MDPSCGGLARAGAEKSEQQVGVEVGAGGFQST